MSDLTALFTQMGFGNVRTVIASGNVLFDSSEKNETDLVKQIEENLNRRFGFPIKVMVLTHADVQVLVEQNLFEKYISLKEARLYVTFLQEKPKQIPELPIRSNESGYEIIAVIANAVCTVTFPLVTGRYDTSKMMAYVERTFGKYSTTRNWNTVVKIANIG